MRGLNSIITSGQMMSLNQKRIQDKIPAPEWLLSLKKANKPSFPFNELVPVVSGSPSIDWTPQFQHKHSPDGKVCTEKLEKKQRNGELKHLSEHTVNYCGISVRSPKSQLCLSIPHRPCWLTNRFLFLNKAGGKKSCGASKEGRQSPAHFVEPKWALWARPWALTKIKQITNFSIDFESKWVFHSNQNKIIVNSVAEQHVMHQQRSLQ